MEFKNKNRYDTKSLNLTEVDSIYDDDSQQTPWVRVLGKFKLLLWFIKNATSVIVVAVVVVVLVVA